jgi:hypothetical protein
VTGATRTGGRRAAAAVGLAAAVALAGCSDRPSAPALGPEAVYRDDAAGLRFLTPDGWSQQAKTLLPPGRLEKATRLVSFTQPGGSAAGFDLYAADPPAGTDLPAYLAEQRLGPERWQLKGPPREETVNGAPATRYEFRNPARKPAGRRLVVAFRRGDRVYLFVLTGTVADQGAFGAFERTVASVTWDR